MLNCPLCETEVQELNPPTSILPSWMLLHISENPECALLADTDLVGEIALCEKCDLRFSREDAFSEEFFLKKSYLRKSESHFEDGVTGIEYFHNNGKNGLLYLLVGMILKQHLFETQQGLNLLGPAFEKLSKDYLGRYLEEENYTFLSFKQVAMESYFTYPKQIHFEKLNAIEVLILGYQFILLTDQRELPDTSPFLKIARVKDLVVILDDESTDPSFKNIRKFAKTFFS